VDGTAFVRERLREHLRVHRDLSAMVPAVVAIADLIVRALRAGRKVIAFGNGGSASDAEHLAAELVGRCVIEHAPLAAVALSANTSALTALGNDYGYEEVFARHLRALGRAGDVAIGITTSGRSENVLRALRAAKQARLRTVALTGRRGLLGGDVDLELRVPSDSTPRVQEAHITAIHAICELVEQRWAAGRTRHVRRRPRRSRPPWPAPTLPQGATARPHGKGSNRRPNLL
jgi:D-sedoheptulose 7-phosphate isomerase